MTAAKKDLRGLVSINVTEGIKDYRTFVAKLYESFRIYHRETSALVAQYTKQGDIAHAHQLREIKAMKHQSRALGKLQ